MVLKPCRESAEVIQTASHTYMYKHGRVYRLRQKQQLHEYKLKTYAGWHIVVKHASTH